MYSGTAPPIGTAARYAATTPTSPHTSRFGQRDALAIAYLSWPLCQGRGVCACGGGGCVGEGVRPTVMDDRRLGGLGLAPWTPFFIWARGRERWRPVT